jgi:L-threonylcarbamoyladenylate synthase
MHYIPFIPENFSLLQEKLDAGEVAIFPSDTSFGISGSPFFPKVVEKIQELKKRPETKPFLLLVADIETARKYGIFSPQIEAFAQQAWSGATPTTLLLPRTNILPDFFPDVPEFGIRVPTNLLLQSFLKSWGKPIISTSANISGANPIFTEKEIRETFGDADILFTSFGDLSLRSQSQIWKEENTKLIRLR